MLCSHPAIQLQWTNGQHLCYWAAYRHRQGWSWCRLDRVQPPYRRPALCKSPSLGFLFSLFILNATCFTIFLNMLLTWRNRICRRRHLALTAKRSRKSYGRHNFHTTLYRATLLFSTLNILPIPSDISFSFFCTILILLYFYRPRKTLTNTKTHERRIL